MHSGVLGRFVQECDREGGGFHHQLIGILDGVAELVLEALQRALRDDAGVAEPLPVWVESGATPGRHVSLEGGGYDDVAAIVSFGTEVLVHFEATYGGPGAGVRHPLQPLRRAMGVHGVRGRVDALAAGPPFGAAALLFGGPHVCGSGCLVVWLSGYLVNR